MTDSKNLREKSQESDEVPILISIAPDGGGGGRLSGVLLVVAVSVTLHVAVMVVVLTAVVILAGGLIPAGFRGKELLGRAGQDVPVSLRGRRSGRVSHGTRPVRRRPRRRRRRAARDGGAAARLDGTARLELGLLLLFCGAGLRRVGDAAAGDRLLGVRRRRARRSRPQMGLV